jgi:uncharacterized protein with PIN domain
VNDVVSIVFFPDGQPIKLAIREWQARNPGWRVMLDDVIVCPVCGLPVRAIADTALMDPDAVREAVREYREEHLRAACSDHYWPTEEHWARVESGGR